MAEHWVARWVADWAEEWVCTRVALKVGNLVALTEAATVVLMAASLAVQSGSQKAVSMAVQRVKLLAGRLADNLEICSVDCSAGRWAAAKADSMECLTVDLMVVPLVAVMAAMKAAIRVENLVAAKAEPRADRLVAYLAGLTAVNSVS